MRILLAAALAALALERAAAFDPASAPEAPTSGTYCGPSPAGQLGAVVARIARAAGLTWTGTRGRDQDGREITFLYDGAHRMVGYDCDAHAPSEGPSIANTVRCGDAVFLVFGVGVCEAARGESEVAAVAAHELSHFILNHHQAQIDYNESAFSSWIASPLGRDERARIRRELGRRATRARLEDALWARFMEQSRPVRERFLRSQETQADREGINVLGMAGFDRRALAEILRHAAELRSAVHLEPSTRHPPSEAREIMVRELASEFSGEGVSR